MQTSISYFCYRKDIFVDDVLLLPGLSLYIFPPVSNEKEAEQVNSIFPSLSLI